MSEEDIKSELLSSTKNWWQVWCKLGQEDAVTVLNKVWRSNQNTEKEDNKPISKQGQSF